MVQSARRLFLDDNPVVQPLSLLILALFSNFPGEMSELFSQGKGKNKKRKDEVKIEFSWSKKKGKKTRQEGPQEIRSKVGPGSKREKNSV